MKAQLFIHLINQYPDIKTSSVEFHNMIKQPEDYEWKYLVKHFGEVAATTYIVYYMHRRGYSNRYIAKELLGVSEPTVSKQLMKIRTNKQEHAQMIADVEKVLPKYV